MSDSLCNYILFISFECPSTENANCCVLRKIRTIKNVEDRIEYIESLTEEERIQIILKHKECSFNREGEKNTINDSL